MSETPKKLGETSNAASETAGFSESQDTAKQIDEVASLFTLDTTEKIQEEIQLLESLPAQVGTIFTVQLQPPEPNELPTSPEKIKQRLAAIPQELTQLEGEYSSLIKTIETAGKELEWVDSKSENAAQEFIRITEKIHTTYAEAGSIALRIKKVEEEYKLLGLAYEQHGLSELGFKSREEYEIEREQLDIELSGIYAQIRAEKAKLRNLPSQFLFGAFATKELKELIQRKDTLRKQAKSLWSLAENGQPLEYRMPPPYFSGSDYEYLPRRISYYVTGKATSVIEARYDKLLIDADRDSREQHIKVPQTVIDTVNDTYLQKAKIAIEQALLQARQNRDEEAIKQLSDQESIAYTMSLLKKAFSSKEAKGRPTNTQYGNLPRSLIDELQNIPPRLRSAIGGTIAYGIGYADDTYNHFTQLVTRRDAFEAQRTLLASYKKVVKTSGLWQTQYYAENKVNGLQQEADQEFTRFDQDRWEVFKSNPDVQRLLGKDALQTAERYVGERLRSILLETLPVRGNDAADIGRKLLRFTYPEIVPFNIMNAYREKGYSDQMPLLSERSYKDGKVLFNYLDGLSNTEANNLRSLNIPGLSELVELILDNPGSFTKDTLRDRDTDEEIENPVAQKVHTEMMRMVSHYLREGGPEMHLFIVQLLRKLDLNKAWGDALPDILKVRQETTDPELAKEITDGLVNKAAAGDEQALDALFAHLDVVSIEQWATITIVLSREETLKPEQLTLLGQKFGLLYEDMLAIINCIQTIRPYSDSSAVMDESKNIKTYIRLASDPGIVTLITDLAQYGYRFNPKHTDTLFAVYPQRDEIMEDIKGIRQQIPDYEYDFCEHYIPDKDGEGKTEFITDPFGVGVYREDSVGVLRFSQLLYENMPVDRKSPKFQQLSKHSIEAIRFKCHGNRSVDDAENRAFSEALEQLLLKLKKSDIPSEQRTCLQGNSFAELMARSPVVAGVVIRGIDRMNHIVGNESLSEIVFKKGEVLIADQSDLIFLNGIAGRNIKAARDIIADYTLCLEDGVITRADKEVVLEFLDQFRILSPALMKGYIEARRAGTQEVYLTGLRSTAEELTGPKPFRDEKRQPYFEDLIRAVYQNNSTGWTNYQQNESCTDRSADLEGFVVKPRYEIDLLSASAITVKPGESLDAERIEVLKQKILSVARTLEAADYNQDKVNQELELRVDTFLGGMDIKMPQGLSLEKKLFLLLTDTAYGSRSVDLEEVKQVLITYEFANFEDVRAFIAGTSDRVSRASNKDYALLCELNTFFSDRVKEVNRRLAQVAWSDPVISEMMPQYHQALSHEAGTQARKNTVARLQPDKLGLSEGFIRQISRVLTKRGKTYTPEQVRALVSRYESATKGLQKDNNTSTRSKAFHGILKTQRERTLAAVKELTGEVIAPEELQLNTINIDTLLSEQKVIEGTYDEEAFAAYTVKQFLKLFEQEVTDVQMELGKFQSESGKAREVLRGYITKTKESAHARMVGGVCVAGDNPAKSGDKCMWNMQNFFQLVLQDPESYRCQGLVMLHHFTTKEGKRILSASLNPSSTYLYTVDEQAMYRGLLKAITEFANDNSFDAVVLSKNTAIRTNRTGGGFEQAMNNSIAQIQKEVVLDEPVVFSYNPSYQMDRFDVVWERP